jgi:hypothetical protein
MSDDDVVLVDSVVNLMDHSLREQALSLALSKERSCRVSLGDSDLFVSEDEISAVESGGWLRDSIMNVALM